MTDSSWRFVFLLGLLAAGIGVVLGLTHVKVAALNGTQDCGSPWSRSNYAYEAGSAVAAECDAKLSDRTPIVWVLVAGGAIVAYYAQLQTVSGPTLARTDAEEPSDPPPTVET